MDKKLISMVSGVTLLTLSGAAWAGPMPITSAKDIAAPVQVEQVRYYRHYYHHHGWRHYGWHRGWHYGWYRHRSTMDGATGGTTTAGGIQVITAGTLSLPLRAPPLAWQHFPSPSPADGPIMGTVTRMDGSHHLSR